ncbi:MAG: TlpA family protein disulfide reductase [Desulfuromonadales bacterium]|nr:TlpA family protein disulfide reductase [Desulfuromonadales bacterium]
MKKNNSAGNVLCCALFIIALTCFFASTAMALKIGDSAPDFAVLDMQGIQRTMTDYQGQVVIVNFWATYCPPCREEKPSMEKFYQENKDQGLQILAVTGEKKRSVERYLKKFPLSLKVLRDEQGTMHRSYGVLSYPQSFVVDRHGTIVHVFFGSQDWTGRAVSEVIFPLLAE